MMAQVSEHGDRASGARVVDLARTWIGTPYRHQASCRGAGADCLGLVRGLWRQLYGTEPEAVPPYSADWAETGSEETLLLAASRHFVDVAPEIASDGDVALLRMIDGAAAKHLGVLAHADAGHATLIHAYSGHGVVESPLTPVWKSRIVAYFRFPQGIN